jgi:hypothetical protein
MEAPVPKKPRFTHKPIVRKLIALLIALLGVMAMMRFLSEDQVRGSLTGIFDDVAVFNLCETRIHAMTFPDGKKIEEQNGKWIATDPKPHEMTYLDVEKWLGANCKFRVGVVKDPPKHLSSVVLIEFVNTEKRVITGGPGAIFSGGKQAFHSPEFERALQDLRRLAQFD